MRVLLDEQLPRHLARELKGHEVRTVQQQGWAGLNGSHLAVMILVARSNSMEDLLPLVPSLLAVIPESRPGQVVRVDA